MIKADKIYQEVGRNIRRFRKNAHQTQAHLAARVGISRTSLANIEAGRQQILLHYLYSIAESLELSSPSLLMPNLSDSQSLTVDATELPLPQEGLNRKQRQDVLRLMGCVLDN
ncbi:MAG: helix-turn-helix transcriptional regulator [Gammaproteobacteria bacterium]|nr:helix-turn-helix transcriptional regulator [Gammaproteobacteria bacterium]